MFYDISYFYHIPELIPSCLSLVRDIMENINKGIQTKKSKLLIYAYEFNLIMLGSYRLPPKTAKEYVAIIQFLLLSNLTWHDYLTFYIAIL